MKPTTTRTCSPERHEAKRERLAGQRAKHDAGSRKARRARGHEGDAKSRAHQGDERVEVSRLLSHARREPGRRGRAEREVAQPARDARRDEQPRGISQVTHRDFLAARK